MDAPEESLDRFFLSCGKALCWAQMLEQEVLNGILLHAAAQKTITSRDEALHLLSQKEKQPLRTKLKQVFDRVQIEPDLSPKFFEAVDKRNFFVHQFLWDRYEQWAIPKKREKVIGEVRELEALFHDAYLFAKGITDLYAKQLGVTEDMVMDELRRMFPDEPQEVF
jgi:hypothetical protein